MLPIRSIRLAVVLLLALVLAACAGNRPQPYPPPPEISQFAGELREDNFVNPDGLNIFGREWVPLEDPRAVVVLIHGTTEHSGIYDDLGRYLAAKGYYVYGIDLQGWGRSDGIGKRGDVYNHDKYVTDVALVVDRLRAEFPDRPVFGFGESLGGMVALLGQTQRRTFFDGLILSAPAYKPNVRLPLGFHMPDIFNNWAIGIAGWGGSKVPTWPAISSDLGLRYILRNDPAMRDRMLEDPYVTHNWLPARYVSAIAESSKFLQKHVEVINVPIFVMQGDRDELIPESSSEELVHRVLSRDRKLKVYKGMGHAIMLQPERYEGIADIGKWLDDHTLPRNLVQQATGAAAAVPVP